MTPQTRRLLQMAETWSADEPASDPQHTPHYRPRQVPPLEEQLGEAGVAKLVGQFLNRTATQQELADQYGTSVSSVKRLIHAHGAQLWRRRPKRAS